MIHFYKLRMHGFSLVEMAVVLVILGLVMVAFISPLSMQHEIRNIEGTRASLHQINEAIHGFVILNGRLPCPTTQPDPLDATYGEEDCSFSGVEGFLPWKTLGVNATDEWGTPRRTATEPWNGHWRYRREANFGTNALFQANILSTSSSVFTNALIVRNSSGVVLTSETERPIAIIYSTGRDLLPNGLNAEVDSSYESDVSSPVFDDVLIWITRPSLVNRLVAAGRLTQ